MRPWSRLAVVAACAVAFLAAAYSPHAPETPAGPDAEALARQVCTGCHVFPPPDSLPRKAWGTVAYEMAGLIMGRVGLPGADRPSRRISTSTASSTTTRLTPRLRSLAPPPGRNRAAIPNDLHGGS
jgi:hypothetical protein